MRISISKFFETVNIHINKVWDLKNIYYVNTEIGKPHFCYISKETLKKYERSLDHVLAYLEDNNAFPNLENFLNSRGTISTKIGNLLKELSFDKLSQKQIDDYCLAYKSYWTDNNQVLLDNYEMIIEDVYTSYKKTDIKSCMTHSINGVLYFQLYDLFGVNCLRLVDKKENKDVARCLIWDHHLTSKGNPIKMIDRIYGEDYARVVLTNYFLKKDYIVRAYNNNHDKTLFRVNEYSNIETVHIDLLDENLLKKIENLYHIPYMDTLTYFHKQESLSNVECNDNAIKLASQNFESINELMSSKCQCSVCNDHYTEDEITIINDKYICDGCRIDYYAFCTDTQEFELKENTFYCETDRQHYAKRDEVILINDKYYLYDDNDIVNIGDEYYLKSDERVMYDHNLHEFILIQKELISV